MRLTAKALLCQTLVRYTFGSPPVNLFIRGNLWKDAGYPLPRAPPPASTAACVPNSVPPRPRLAGAEELKREWVGDPLLILLFCSSFGVPRARFLTLGLRVSGSFSFLLSPFSFLLFAFPSTKEVNIRQVNRPLSVRTGKNFFGQLYEVGTIRAGANDRSCSILTA